jgi:uncharacterized membrane protein
MPLLLGVGQAQFWQSPFPPPEAVERYEAILPGAFDRILRMNEELQAANIASAERAQAYMRGDMRRGHWLGFVLSLAALAGALACVKLGAPVVAGVFLALPVMSVAKALVDSARYGMKAQSGHDPKQRS